MNKKKKNKWIPIVVLVVIMVVLGALAALVMITGSDDSSASSTTTTAAADLVYAGSTSDINYISYYKDGELLEFSKSNDTWGISDSQFPFDDSKIGLVETCVKSLSVTRTLSDGMDKAGDYGLVSPTNTLTVSGSDDYKMVLKLGSYNSTLSAYYANIDGSNDVILVPSTIYSRIGYGLMDMIEQEEMPEFSTSNIVSMEMVDSDGSSYIIYDEDGDDSMDYTGTLYWFIKDKAGKLYAADNDKMDTVMNLAMSLSWNTTETYDADGTAMAQYGISDSSRKIVYHYTETYTKAADSSTESSSSSESTTETTAAETVKIEKTYTLLIGNEDSSGNYYAAVDGGENIIYTLQGNFIEEVFDLDPAFYVNENVFNVALTAVDSLEATLDDGKTVTMNIERDGTVTTYTINGNVTNADTFEDLYSTIKSLQSDADLETAVEGTPELTLVYHLNHDGIKTVTIELIPSGTSFYQVNVDGEARILLNKNDVATVISALKEFE